MEQAALGTTSAYPGQEAGRSDRFSGSVPLQHYVAPLAVVVSGWLSSALGNPEQASEAHFGRWCFRAQQSISHHLTDHGSVFEAMARASANNPDIFRFRMSVQDEIVVGGVFILANSAF